MPNRRRSSGQRAAPKLFRCTGYGNCDMVFTRSEHLARHERKHTGEKPYKCVVAGCGRMFSRFDNMMQHTQTHEKNKKITSSGGEKVAMSSSTAAHGLHHHRPSHMSPIKTEQQAATNSWIEQQRKQSMPDWRMMATSNNVPPLEHSSMINSRTLPLPRRASYSTTATPITPTSATRYNNDNVVYAQPMFPINSSNSYRLSYPPVGTSPYYYNNYDTSASVPASAYPYYTSTSTSNNIPPNRSSWPVRRDPYPTQHPAPFYKSDDHYSRRRSSVSTLSSDSSSLYSPTTVYQTNPPPVVQQQQEQAPQISRRRISIDDLRLPIENLRNIQLDEEAERKNHYNKSHDGNYMNGSNHSVDITSDEYEALEGFSKFHSNSVIAKDATTAFSNATDSTPSPVMHTSSPNIAAQVCAMRQRVMPYNESFQRR